MKLKLLTVVLLLALTQTGCTLLMLGGAGAGGYYVGTDERSVGQIAEDASITTAVNAKYITDKKIDTLDIDVDTYNSVVTLNGHVSHSSQRSRSIQLARSVDGVRRVISNLRVIPD